MIAKKVLFHGRVQGVGFRYAVKDLARSFDVCGWVKNLADGSVELQVMGQKAEVDSLIQEISAESSVAHHIKSVVTESIPPLANCKGFSIHRDLLA